MEAVQHPKAEMSGDDRSDHAGGRRKAGVLALSFALSLALLEIVVRIQIGNPLPERLPLLLIQANPARGWEMVPGETHYTYLHPVHVNALGLRGQDLPPKEPGEIRVLALGDSQIYGQGVAEQETIPIQLQALLNERDARARKWTVVNGGFRGYSTNQELEVLRELGPRMDLDIVVLFWFWNDVSEPNVRRQYDVFRQSGPVTFDTEGRVEGWAKVRWQARQLLRRSALLLFLHDLHTALTYPFPDAKVQDDAMKRLRGYLEEFQRIATRERYRLMFAVVPDPNRLLGSHPSAEVSERADQVAKTIGIPTLDLLSPLKAAYQETPAFPTMPFDGHYRPWALRTMAASLSADLLSH